MYHYIKLKHVSDIPRLGYNLNMEHHRKKGTENPKNPITGGRDFVPVSRNVMFDDKKKEAFFEGQFQIIGTYSPKSETWRFGCISSGQVLLARASAAFAVVFMMV